MSKLLTPGHRRIAIQICAMTAVAALMSGCSADSNRFGDAFGNPFATGSVQKPKKVAHASQPLGTGRTPPVMTSALPPRGQVASVAPPRAAPVAVSHETTGSIGPARSVPGASFGGWTGQGGASVQVGQGDTAGKLAERYGVPLNVLLQVNGLHSASEVQPGGTIVVPIYNAVATAPGAARVAQAPMRSEPIEPAEPVRVAPQRAARVEEPAEPVRKPGLPFKVADKPQTLAERNAEAQRIVATQRAADKAAAEKAAMAERATVAQKAAEAEKIAAARKAAAAEKLAEAEKAKLAKAEAGHKVAAKDPASRVEAQKAAAAEKAAAAQKLAAEHEAAKAKAEAVKAAAAAAKAAKLAAATPAKPAPAAKTAPAAKPEQVAAVEKKAVDPTTTASVPAAAPAAAPSAAPAPAVTADAGGGPEFRWPARGRIIQGFKGGSGGNDGINIAVPEGTAVKAAEGGVVAYAGNELKGYGNLVLIRHPNGYVTAYANNGEIDVKRGETVKRGQMIAKSGQSGNVSSPQLHFEVRKGSTPIDPTGFLAGT